ncbi:NADH-quinone oxidoreductase subunit NuoF [Thermoflavifilum thermophilum]|uniref:NADH-quinone oxidoreductase subunit F n=1 Tax=Thermoflavifilum thermophilum TaxID=1393122 RepID=A0A1I7N6T2_9BACT|nr:NADH-quinone oxidoreductase subunit NuoF [Thermoflavifilum thermophilum]SFV30382.1 NADH dehydrogenase subunit F [Thermoflavifilum thermophilum]
MEKPLTAHIPKDGSWLRLKDYERVGGYQGLRQALKMTPKEVIDMVKDAGLRGRGGAGFATGLKWSLVPTPDQIPGPHYLIANGDEMEPGTFKDRLLLEGNPHQLIEGMIIGAYAIQAEFSYVFLRWGYQFAEKALEEAIHEAYEAGYLGKNILGSGFSHELSVHISAGRYICGEETALINALEGKRANPRAKPPFPVVSGFFGRPTVVNNIETLSNVPHILSKGVSWYKSLSKCEDGGTKLYGVSGKVKRPGLWELPLGTSFREILEEHAGGMRDGYQFKGALPGGGSTDFITAEHLDVAMDYNSVAKVGSRMGTGTIIVLDDKTCVVGMVLNLEHFFAQESCGWCTPCREGLPWTEKLLLALENGEGKMEDLKIFDDLTRYMGPGNTFCALAPGAMEPLQSALKHFRADFERHIHEHRCPWK